VAVRLPGLRVRILQEHEYLSLVGVACSQSEVSVSGLSLVQRISTECEKPLRCGGPDILGPVAPEKILHLTKGDNLPS
jgi:hypothetical protein